MHKFEFHGVEQKQILLQVASKVVDKQDIFYDYLNNQTGRKQKATIGIECTLSQKVEIEFLASFYQNLWEQEKKRLLSAFVSKHKLFGETTTNERELSREEALQMIKMMSALQDVSPLTAIDRA